MRASVVGADRGVVMVGLPLASKFGGLERMLPVGVAQDSFMWQTLVVSGDVVVEEEVWWKCRGEDILSKLEFA